MRRSHLAASGFAAVLLFVTAGVSQAQTIIAELKVEGGDYTQIDDPFDPDEAIIVDLGSVPAFRTISITLCLE